MTKVITGVHSVHLVNVEQPQAAADPQTKPSNLSCESAWFRQLSSTTTIAIYYYYSARKLILIYRPTEGRGLYSNGVGTFCFVQERTLPYIIGLTGSTASGKSSVCARLERLGAAIIDCDKLGKFLFCFRFLHCLLHCHVLICIFTKYAFSRYVEPAINCLVLRTFSNT